MIFQHAGQNVSRDIGCRRRRSVILQTESTSPRVSRSAAAKVAQACMKRASRLAAGLLQLMDDSPLSGRPDFPQQMERNIQVAHSAGASHDFLHLTPQQTGFFAGQPGLQDLQNLPESSHRDAQIVHRFDALGFHRVSGVKVQSTQ
jgi:hypothetical protein